MKGQPQAAKARFREGEGAPGRSPIPWVVVDELPSPRLFWCHVRGWRARSEEATPFFDFAEALEEALTQQADLILLSEVQR